VPKVLSNRLLCHGILLHGYTSTASGVPGPGIAAAAALLRCLACRPAGRPPTFHLAGSFSLTLYRYSTVGPVGPECLNLLCFTDDALLLKTAAQLQWQRAACHAMPCPCQLLLVRLSAIDISLRSRKQQSESKQLNECVRGTASLKGRSKGVDRSSFYGSTGWLADWLPAAAACCCCLHAWWPSRRRKEARRHRPRARGTQGPAARTIGCWGGGHRASGIRSGGAAKQDGRDERGPIVIYVY
jgi:hypothetical protein